METQEKYSINMAPIWAKSPSNDELILLSKDSPEDLEIKKSGKGLVYIKREIIDTSNTKNQKYIFDMWSVSNPNMLQGASVTEILLRDNEELIIHRFAIIRDDEIFINKTNSTTIRILDSEESSSYGLINKQKKIHCIVDDLRLGDTVVFEYTIITNFREEHFLDKKYFGYIKTPSPWQWFYKKYNFSVVNNRDSNLCVSEKYFRNSNGDKIDTPIQIIQPNNTFSFEKDNFQFVFSQDFFYPCIEIATESSWKQISTDIYNVYKIILEDGNNITNTKAYKSLNINDNTIDENIRNIIEYVQNDISYLYDAEIMHGHIPQDPFKTIDQRLGDCKAKSALLVNLLSTIGVISEIILVNYSYDYLITNSLPSPFLFNHCIVRVNYNNKNYFIDPVWSRCCGFINKRAEPFMSNYLPVCDKNNDIAKRNFREVGDDFVEENTTVYLHDKKVVLESVATYRKELADRYRNIFKDTEKSQLIKDKNNVLLERIQASSQTDNDTEIVDAEFVLLSDNQDLNEIKFKYVATILKPYSVAGMNWVFRYYYYSLEIGDILTHSHQDYLCSSFASFPLKYNLKINSDFFINWNDSATKKEKIVSNDYFTFTNKKSVSFKKAEVTSEYIPKMYGYIKKEDLKKVQEDYRSISNSNFGIGVVELDFFRFIKNYLIYVFPLIIILKVLQAVFFSD